ncbi:MAG TPA: hypothetical protein VIM41_03495 [Gammaproteobacteria bacterium]
MLSDLHGIKKEFLEHVNAFSHQVLDDCNPPQPAPGGALGKLNPGD